MLKKVILFLFIILVTVSFSQVTIQDKVVKWQKVMNSKTIATSFVYSESFSLGGVKGATTVWFDTISVTNTTDTLVFGVQGWNEKTREWATYATGDSMVAFIISTLSFPMAFNISKYDAGKVAYDKIRIATKVCNTSIVGDMWLRSQ